MINCLFPIYDVKKFAISVKVNEQDLIDVDLISLDKIFIREDIGFVGDIKLRLFFKDKEFKFSGYLDVDKKEYRGVSYSSIRLYFDNPTVFTPWSVFIKVIHKTKLKKQLQLLL